MTEKELAIKIFHAIGDDEHGEVVFKALVIVNAEFLKQQSGPHALLELLTDNIRKLLPQ